jgi:hypothetical protein
VNAPLPILPGVGSGPNADTYMRKWTIMVYMAGDNGKVFKDAKGEFTLMPEMTSAGYADIAKMAQVGSTRDVDVICLFDTANTAYMVEVKKGGGFNESLVSPLPGVNTGSSDVLRDFIIKCLKWYPCEHAALVIWNHGAGWLDVDPYDGLRAARTSMPRRQPIFRSSPRRLANPAKVAGITRAIAFDDSSMDFLDAGDLRQALSEAKMATGQKLDIIGMDACLMAAIEGAVELSPHADYFVASQEVEPMSGWPYAGILQELTQNPEMPPREVAGMIVSEFGSFYGAQTARSLADATVTLSAMDLAQTPHYTEQCKRLVDAIMAGASLSLRDKVMRAVIRSLSFEDRNYHDLGDFLAQLRSNMGFSPNIYRLVGEMQNMFDSSPASDDLVMAQARGSAQALATGASVWLPRNLYSQQRAQTLDLYSRLSFAQQTGWGDMVSWLLGGEG